MEQRHRLDWTMLAAGEGEYLQNRLDVLMVVRNLVRRDAPAVFYPEGTGPFRSAQVLSANREEGDFLLDLGNGFDQAPAGVLVAWVDGVKIQLALPAGGVVSTAGAPLLRYPLPAGVVKLQRREYYRTDLRAIEARLRVSLPDFAPCLVEIVDLSAGGICFVAPAFAPSLAQGVLLGNAELMLANESSFPVTLVVCSRSAEANRVCYGCSFEGLSAGQQAAISRFILDVERERRRRNG